MRIALDVDGCIANFNKHLADKLAAEGFPGATFPCYSIKDALPKEMHGPSERILTRPGFAASMPRYAGAQDFYRELKKLGDVSAATVVYPGSGAWPHERYDWLLSFGFADQDIYLLDTPEQKLAFPCDVLIEDRLETLQKMPPRVTRILIDREWNQQSSELDEAQDIYRMTSYHQVLAVVTLDGLLRRRHVSR